MIPLPIGNGFYVSRSLPVSAQTCKNLYVSNPQTEGALSQAVLFGTAGLTGVISTGEIKQINRGSYVKDGKPYFLNGETLYRVDHSLDIVGNDIYSLATLGTITGEDRASFATNGKQLIVIANGDGYIIDESSGTPFQVISDLDFKANGTPQQVVFLDSFFLVTTDEKKIIKSAANDGLNWNALDFGSAEADPDDITGIIAFKGQAFVAGTETIEVFENRGTAGFPFFKVGGFILNKGVTAPASLVKTSDSFMFVGGGRNEAPSIWALAGNSVQKIATDCIDSIIANMSNDEVKGCFAWSYAEEGAYFVGFTFASICLVYDLTSGKWHTRESRIINARGLTENVRFRANSMVSAYNKIMVGDSIDGRIGVLSMDTYTEYEMPIIREFVTMPVSVNGNSFSILAVELTVESGIGDNPVYRLSTTRDARRFGYEKWRDSGAIGEYNKRVVWRRLGRFNRYAAMKFECSEPVKISIIKLEANIVGNQ